jgi:CubicO group peptidase (beta-lactamase class C family)
VDPAHELLSGAPAIGRTDALLVQQHGAVVLERYGDGIRPTSTLRSWSMAKSMLHAAVGILVAEGRLALDDPAPVPQWSAAGDPRQAITLRHLLTMRPGLQWAEEYHPGQPSDVIEMLFGEDGDPQVDAAAYAASKPLVAEPGSTFVYSSGTSNIVSAIVRDAVGPGSAYERWLRDRLFGPLGMGSATPKFDAVGTWIASSYCFCTARDFAAFGQCYLDGGRVGGAAVLAPEWVAMAAEPTGTDEEGRVHTHHWWRFRPLADFGAFYASGFEGQYTIVVPGLDLVAVRLGWTNDDARDAVQDALTSLVRSFAGRRVQSSPSDLAGPEGDAG